MHVVLVNMPWALLDFPSLALGVLRQSVLKILPDVSVGILHGHLDYVDWVVGRTDFTFEDYQFYSLDSYFWGCGDWVFTSALWNDSDSRVR